MIALAESAAIVGGIALVPLAAKSLGMGWVAGFGAAFFSMAGARRMPESEGNYTALLLILATLLACRYADLLVPRRRKAGSAIPPAGGNSSQRALWATAALLGILWGVILLLTPPRP